MHRNDYAHLLDHRSDQVDYHGRRTAVDSSDALMGERLCVHDLRPHGLLLLTREEGGRHSGRKTGPNLHLAGCEVSFAPKGRLGSTVQDTLLVE